MKRFSSIIVILLLYISTSVLFFWIHPYYQTGKWVVDMILCLLVETIAFGVPAYILKKEKIEVQSIALGKQLISFVSVATIIIIAHVVSSIFCSTDWIIVYYLLLLIVTVFFSVKFFFVHSGSEIQLQTDKKINGYVQEQREVISTLSSEVTLLLTSVNNCSIAPINKLKISDVVKSTVEMINSLPVMTFQRKPQLSEEIKKWSISVRQQKQALKAATTAEEQQKLLNEIYDKTQEIYATINNYK